MSISLPTNTATIFSEYAASNISFNRSVQPDSNGHLVTVFSGNIAYNRTDYVVDTEGNKLNVIQQNRQFVPTPMYTDPYSGNIRLEAAELATLSATIPTVDLLTAIAAGADALIHEDLVKRGIITV
jgi:hypothetical protein